jgi:sulfite oxidase
MFLGEGPDIAPEQWRLTVDGMADKPLTVTYDELTAGFTGLNR